MHSVVQIDPAPDFTYSTSSPWARMAACMSPTTVDHRPACGLLATRQHHTRRDRGSDSGHREYGQRCRQRLSECQGLGRRSIDLHNRQRTDQGHGHLQRDRGHLHLLPHRGRPRRRGPNPGPPTPSPSAPPTPTAPIKTLPSPSRSHPSQVSNSTGTTVISADPITGEVRGSLQLGGNGLSYMVISPPARGTVTVTSSGSYTYKPTQAARLAADQTAGPDTDSFTVRVSNGQTSTDVAVSVPVSPARMAVVDIILACAW